MYKVDRERDNLVLTIRGPVNFLTVGFVKILMENKMNSSDKMNCKKTTQKEKNITTTGTDNAGYVFDNEDETVPDKNDKYAFVILDLIGVTSLDSKGCSLVPWLESKVKEEGSWLGLVVV